MCFGLNDVVAKTWDMAAGCGASGRLAWSCSRCTVSAMEQFVGAPVMLRNTLL
jgi:hypothetical protein